MHLLHVQDRIDGFSSSNLTPTYQTPVLFNATRQSDFLVDFRANGTRQTNFCKISLCCYDSSSSAQRSNVHQQHFGFRQFRNLRKNVVYQHHPKTPFHIKVIYFGSLFVTLGSHAQQSLEQVIRDFQLDEDLGKSSNSSQNLTHHTIGTTQSWLDLGTNTWKLIRI